MAYAAALWCQGWWRDCGPDRRSIRSGADAEARPGGTPREAAGFQLNEELVDGGPVRGESAALDPLVDAVPATLGTASALRPARARAKTADVQQIQKDVPRTFFDRPDVLQLSDVIEDVLRKYAAADAEVGYCQGMSFVAAVTAFQFRTADAAYERFCMIVSRIRGLWLPGLPLLLTGVSAFEALCSSCFQDLQPCLGAQNVTFDMFLPDAWLTLFSRWLPFAALWAVFELVEFEGFPGVLAVTAVLLKAHKPVILQADSFKDMFVTLKELAKQPRQPDVPQLLASAQELIPRAHRALHEAVAASDQGPQRTTSTLTRCGPCIVHAKSGVELLDCGWPTLAGTLHAMATVGKAAGKDHVLGVFRARTDTPTTSSLSTKPRSSSGVRSARRWRIPCFCPSTAPREDA
mmetsp:Transcript_65310/g.194699  ORF Transcript_65310/g.194699 Transcript_65310/m.194699 type:complete len:406 (-) Transcript_65310:94-1311(-)